VRKGHMHNGSMHNGNTVEEMDLTWGTFDILEDG
jgi:hypothetical protein